MLCGLVVLPRQQLVNRRQAGRGRSPACRARFCAVKLGRRKFLPFGGRRRRFACRVTALPCGRLSVVRTPPPRLTVKVISHARSSVLPREAEKGFGNNK